MQEPEGDSRSALHRWLPEQRIYIKTGEDHTRYFVLSPQAQVGAGVAAFIVGTWIVVATSALLLGMISADNEQHQAAVMQQAYESRIAAISQERDQRAKEAGAIQTRFQLALTELSDSQSNIMTLQAEGQELRTSLQLMRDKLSTAVNRRDMASDDRDRLSEELNQAVTDLRTKLSSVNALTSTLDTINGALGETVEERDLSQDALVALEQQLADMEFRAQVESDRQERMFSQLENAVLIALDPLERLLATSGQDVDALLKQVREQYSGEGGPFIPAAFSADKEDPTYVRYRALMEDLDRAHLMQIAANKIPFAVPVRQSIRFTSGFGRRRDPITGSGRMHSGQDMAGPPGTPILAAGDGIVIFAGRQSGYGNVVKIRHSFGYETVYAHLRKYGVKTGDSVSRGDVIGGMGNTGRSTGTHLHYEIRIGGTPVNPMPYMKAARNVF